MSIPKSITLMTLRYYYAQINDTVFKYDAGGGPETEYYLAINSVALQIKVTFTICDCNIETDRKMAISSFSAVSETVFRASARDVIQNNITLIELLPPLQCTSICVVDYNYFLHAPLEHMHHLLLHVTSNIYNCYEIKTIQEVYTNLTSRRHSYLSAQYFCTTDTPTVCA